MQHVTKTITVIPLSDDYLTEAQRLVRRQYNQGLLSWDEYQIRLDQDKYGSRYGRFSKSQNKSR